MKHQMESLKLKGGLINFIIKSLEFKSLKEQMRLITHFEIILSKKLSKKLSCQRSSRPEVFLRKGVLKICSKLTGENPCRSAISIN